MEKWTTKNGYEVYKVLSGRSNAYFIKFNGVAVLVDTGKTSVYSQLIKNLSRLGLLATNENFLVLTHTHFDHCQNAWALSNLHNFKIVISREESESVKQGYTPLPKGTNALTRLLSLLGNRYLSRIFCYRPFHPDVLVSNGDMLVGFGLNIKLVPTPGHSVGSISVVVDNEIALVGDTLFGVFPNSVFPPFADNPEAMVSSWNTLLQTNCRLFLPGHGKPISRKLLLKEYRKHYS